MHCNTYQCNHLFIANCAFSCVQFFATEEPTPGYCILLALLHRNGYFICRQPQLPHPLGQPVIPQGLGMGSPLSTWPHGHSCGWTSVLTLGMAATPPTPLPELWLLLASRYMVCDSPTGQCQLPSCLLKFAEVNCVGAPCAAAFYMHVAFGFAWASCLFACFSSGVHASAQVVSQFARVACHC